MPECKTTLDHASIMDGTDAAALRGYGVARDGVLIFFQESNRHLNIERRFNDGSARCASFDMHSHTGLPLLSDPHDDTKIALIVRRYRAIEP
jgi:hypothetical protein